MRYLYSVKESTLVSNRPTATAAGTPNAPSNEYGRLRTINGIVELAVADLGAADVVVLCGLPTNAVVLSILLANDDLDTGVTNTMDVGLYSDRGVTAKDDDVYAAASTQLRAAAGFTEQAFVTRNIDKCGQKVWQDAGDTSDPGDEYFLCLTFDAAGNQAGTVAFQVTLAVD